MNIANLYENALLSSAAYGDFSREGLWPVKKTPQTSLSPYFEKPLTIQVVRGFFVCVNHWSVNLKAYINLIIYLLVGSIGG